MSKINQTLPAYFDARDQAAGFRDSRYTDDALKAERARMLDPAADALASSVELAQRDGKASRAAYTAAVLAALTDNSDNSRVLAREMAWARLLRRFDRGESVDSVVRSASAIELEALAGVPAQRGPPSR